MAAGWTRSGGREVKLFNGTKRIRRGGFGSRGQGGNAVVHVANVVPVLLARQSRPRNGDSQAIFRSSSGTFSFPYALISRVYPLNDGSDQSRLEVDDALARRCQALKRKTKDNYVSHLDSSNEFDLNVNKDLKLGWDQEKYISLFV